MKFALPIALIFLTTVSWSNAWSTINERCTRQPNHPEECNPISYLICGDNSRCMCTGDKTWISTYNRCVFKIDHACSSYDHGGNLPGCPPNAFCHHTTGKCECKQEYRANKDRSRCTNGANKTVTGSIWILTVIAALWTSNKSSK